MARAYGSDPRHLPRTGLTGAFRRGSKHRPIAYSHSSTVAAPVDPARNRFFAVAISKPGRNQVANISSVLDTIELRDLEDSSKLSVIVQSCTELGNSAAPGLQVSYLGYILNLEPLSVERWAYQARKAGQDVFLLEDHSWNVHADQYIRNSLVLGDPLKVRVEVKTRSRSAPLTREYALPFQVEE